MENDDPFLEQLTLEKTSNQTGQIIFLILVPEIGDHFKMN